MGNGAGISDEGWAEAARWPQQAVCVTEAIIPLVQCSEQHISCIPGNVLGVGRSFWWFWGLGETNISTLLVF